MVNDFFEIEHIKINGNGPFISLMKIPLFQDDSHQAQILNQLKSTLAGSLPVDRKTYFNRITEADRFHFVEDKIRCLASGVLLQLALKEKGVEFPFEEKNKKGKSFLPNHQELEISLTHSGPWIAWAIHHSSVGIDIENENIENDEDIAQNFMSPKELTEFGSLSPNNKKHFFIQNWTIKESYLKAIGEGMALDPKLVSLQILNQVSFEALSPLPTIWPKTWNLYSKNLTDGYRLALCWA